MTDKMTKHLISGKYCPNTAMPKFFNEINDKFDFVAFNPSDSRIYNSLGTDYPRYICLYHLTITKTRI